MCGTGREWPWHVSGTQPGGLGSGAAAAMTAKLGNRDSADGDGDGGRDAPWWGFGVSGASHRAETAPARKPPHLLVAWLGISISRSDIWEPCCKIGHSSGKSLEGMEGKGREAGRARQVPGTLTAIAIRLPPTSEAPVDSLSFSPQAVFRSPSSLASLLVSNTWRGKDLNPPHTPDPTNPSSL